METRRTDGSELPNGFDTSRAGFGRTKSVVPRRGVGDFEDVAALFGHELSTPLATALLYIGIAENHCGLAPGGVRTALRVARHEVQRLKTLVDTLTQFERAGQPVLRPTPGDLGEIVRATVHRTLTTLLPNTVEVTVEVPQPLPGWWDHLAVEQIVGNLMSNALKFGQGRPIRVAARADASGVSISVSDRGAGVAAADRERIFARSVHAPARRGGGLGLGLWLVRELAVAHGGRVTLQSRKGRGSTFTVSLRSRPPEAGRTGGRCLVRQPSQPRHPARAQRQLAAG
jgi:signal transduction histidine kinase